MLSDEQIEKFQMLYKNKLGIEISHEDAYEKGAKLMRLVELVYVPMTEYEYKALQKRRQETLKYKLVNKGKHEITRKKIQ